MHNSFLYTTKRKSNIEKHFSDLESKNSESQMVSEKNAANGWFPIYKERLFLTGRGYTVGYRANNVVDMKIKKKPVCVLGC
jgi:hypothetical protein